MGEELKSRLAEPYVTVRILLVSIVQRNHAGLG
jgi:hypothetical protein